MTSRWHSPANIKVSHLVFAGGFAVGDDAVAVEVFGQLNSHAGCQTNKQSAEELRKESGHCICRLTIQHHLTESTCHLLSEYTRIKNTELLTTIQKFLQCDWNNVPISKNVVVTHFFLNGHFYLSLDPGGLWHGGLLLHDAMKHPRW